MQLYENKHHALNYRLKKRRELMAKLERTLKEIHQLEQEISQLHGRDKDTSETVNEALYEPQQYAEA